MPVWSELTAMRIEDVLHMVGAMNPYRLGFQEATDNDLDALDVLVQKHFGHSIDRYVLAHKAIAWDTSIETALRMMGQDADNG